MTPVTRPLSTASLLTFWLVRINTAAATEQGILTATN